MLYCIVMQRRNELLGPFLMITNNLKSARYAFIVFICFEVMACTAFVASIAGVQSYLFPTYARKADISELLIALPSYKSDITVEYLENGEWPTKRRLDKAANRNYTIIARAEFDGKGAINFYFNDKYPDLKGKILSYSVTQTAGTPIGSILWICGYAKAPEGFEKIAFNITNIKPDFLPSSCK